MWGSELLHWKKKILKTFLDLLKFKSEISFAKSRKDVKNKLID